ncbi:MAG: hypothetical protein VX466_11600 [Myxococcota bacterium]|nr:hypothetical protein [Myxococcota bacterium]
MLCLVLAAWPAEIRPALLDGPSEFMFETLEAVGIRAGMPVFTGSRHKQASIVRARCIEVEAVNSAGAKTRLYPPGPCPQRGFRWKPVVYDHMIYHWVMRLDDGAGPANLWAIGDHFCQQSPDRDLHHVEIAKRVHVQDYETGREWSRRVPIGRVMCRP